MEKFMFKKMASVLLCAGLLTGCGSLATTDYHPTVADCQAMGFSCESVAEVYLDAGNAVMAERFLLLGAEAGRASSQHVLGVRYINAQGIREDRVQGEYWLKRAAEAGHDRAQYSLALEYKVGTHLKQDLEAARYWYTQAAEQGHSMAQNNLGAMYVKGEGVPKNLYMADHLYKLSAAQGNSLAQQNLQNMDQRFDALDAQQKQAMKQEFDQLINPKPVAAMTPAGGPAPTASQARGAPAGAPAHRPAATGGGGGSACTDAELTARFGPELSRLHASIGKTDIGLCMSARTAADLFTRILDATRHCPASARGIAEYRKELQSSLDGAQDQAAKSCG